MAIDFIINENLPEQAVLAGRLKNENKTVDSREKFAKKMAIDKVIELFNSVDYDKDYDYKILRGKR